MRPVLVADLNLKITTLKSTALVAPFLGLAGTCLGILSIFRGYDGSRYGYVVMAATATAAALISTAAGLLVAIVAVLSHNYLRSQTDFLERKMSSAGEFAKRHSQFAQSLPLTPRFTIFPFTVIAVPTLALTIAGFMTFASFHSPMGLDVRLLPVGALETEDDFLAQPIIVGIVEESTAGQIAVYVNVEKTPLQRLGDTVRNKLKSCPQSVAFVTAEKNVRWSDVASIIDTIQSLPAKVILLTSSPPKPIRMGRSAKPMR